jgi:hypothetical protein
MEALQKLKNRTVILLMVLVQSDQKTSKFFTPHQEESMAGHVRIIGVF